MSAGSSSYSIVSEEERCARRFLVATLSKRLRGGVLNIGPSELNWRETPFVCGTDVCRDLRAYAAIEMRRLHALDGDILAEHKFVDLSFVTASCSLSEARLSFLSSNFYLDMCRTNFTKGLFEEVKTIRVADDDFDPQFDFLDPAIADDNAYEYLDEEELLGAIGHVVIAYGNDDGEDDSDATPSSSATFGWQAASDWRRWSTVRELCATLPPACTFRSLAFYREVSGTSPYNSLLLIEVNRAMRHESQVRRCINNLSDVHSNICTALYRAVEFEIDVEALQTLVCVSRSVECMGPYLRVEFFRSVNDFQSEIPRKSGAIYSRREIEGRDWDADMEVLENSKKYSLGLLPKPPGRSIDNNNNDEDEDKITVLDSDVHYVADNVAIVQAQNRLKKRSWQVVRNAFWMSANEKRQITEDGCPESYPNAADNNNNNLAFNGNDLCGAKSPITKRPKHFWFTSLFRRRKTSKQKISREPSTAHYGTFYDDVQKATVDEMPRRKHGMFWRWTHRPS